MRNKIISAITSFSILFSLVSFSQILLKKQDAKYFTMPVDINTGEYIPKTIIVKVKPEFRGVCENSRIKNEELSSALSDLQVNKLFKKFSNKKPPLETKNKIGLQNVDLSLMYEITYNADIPIEDAINKLYATSIFEYVELHYIPVLLYTPNDTYIASQYHLNNIHAFEGWDICKGDTNVVIGIIDTGVDTDHPDLISNIKYNYEDTIDGIDNDNDGYIDNFRGWDVAMNDNNPEAPASGDNRYHGVHVSGIAAASADNYTGVAGVGFKCKFLPVKVANENSSLIACYEGIIYAADHGCSIINCSWGREGGNISQYEQDIINYAVINMNALVVASCGNCNDGNCATYWYPAVYDNALAVAATNSVDTKWITSPTFSSSYYDKVDISAPGAGIYSTMAPGTYSTMNGTSMAAPCIAGCAAIVKSKYPNYTGIQVGELLKATADTIDTLSGNLPYKGKLGTGRVNLYRALTETNHKSAAMTNYIITDNNDNVFVGNDTLHIITTITNYLASISASTITLSSTSLLVNILSPATKSLGAFTTGQTKSNSSSPSPFLVRILPSVQNNLSAKFYITFSDGIYSHKDSFVIVFNKDYVDVNINKITASVSSVGRVGYTDNTHNYGLGFTFNGSLSILNIAGLVVGVSNNRVSDCIYGTNMSNYENDFTTTTIAHTITPAVKSDFDVVTEYHDTLSGVNKLKIMVTQKTYAWSDIPDSKYIILEYYIRNIGTTPLNDLYAGLFADWDIINDLCTESQNRASYDEINKMGYVYCINGGYWAGLKMLTSGPVKYYAFDNDGYYGSYQINDGFASFEKYGAMKNSRFNAGSGANGNDVSHILSSGPYNILSGDTIKIAYAMLAGTNLNDLQTTAQRAAERYTPQNSVKDTENDNSFLFQNFPNPFDGATTIKYQIAKSCFVKIKLLDIYGKEITTLLEKQMSQGKHELEYDGSKLEEGAYYFRFEIDNDSFTKKAIVIH
ncbi:MAG: S8 family serine peptidase [Bacteroidales bacterium]|jgi:hypothetical protein